MGKAKGKWLLALLALAFAAILAAVLCMNFPMAEVHAETAVAKVTAATGETQTYEKLSDAFKAAKDDDTVTLLRNAEIAERIVIENKSVVFDLGEYTLTMDEDFSADYSVALRAGTNGILTIEAGTNGTIDAQNAHDYLVPVAAMASGSRVIINGGTIIVNTAYESCVYAGGGGTVVIEDGVFKNLCQKPFAYVQDGSSPALAVNISDSYTDGGAYLTINGGTFVGRNPMLGDTNPGVTSSYMGRDVNIAQLSDGRFAAVGADDPLPEDTEYFYTEKDGEIVVTVYTPEALAAAVAGDETFADNTFTVVRLGAAIEQGITIADGRVLTLDLNGFTLTNSGDSHTITNSGTLTIIDGGENGEVTNTSAEKAVILNNGEMTLAGGKYTRTADHYVIDNNKGNMTIEAGVTVESPSTLSSMIRNGGDNNAVGATPTLTINGGSFSGGLNTIKNDDYGILHINGGSFSNTTQHVILNWSTATIEGGTFTPQNDAYAAVWTGTWYTSANFTQGVTVIEDGIFNGAVTTGIGKDAPQTTAKADYTISGGTFNAEVNSSADDIGYITGGEFAELPDASAFAPGYVAADPDGDGIYTTVDEAQGDYAVSMTFDNKRAVYESLADALAAAPTDGTEATITLLDNVNENVTIAEGQNITLDLNGFTLTNSGDSHTIYNNGTLRVVGNGTVDNINHGRAALVNYGTAVLDGGKFTRSKEDGKSDSNSWYVILNQGTMTVNDGVEVYTALEVSNYSSLLVNGLEGKDSYPLPIGKYNAYLTVNGGSFMGGVAAIKNDYYGILEVTGGTFGGTGTNTALQNWGEAEISGDAVFEQNVEAYTWLDNYTKGTTTISGGTFLGKVVAREYTSDPDDEDPVVYDKNNVAISGGTFTEPVPAAYMEKGFTLTVNDGTYGVKEAEEVASVTRGEAVYNFATLAEALAFAEDGDMVALLKPATLSETLVIDKAVTLDLGSNALSVNVAGGVGIRIDADNVTVTGGTGGTISATADTVFAVYVNGAKGVLLEGVTIEAHDVAVRAEYDASVKLQNSVIDVTVIENGGSANAVEIIGSDMEIADTSITSVAEPDTLTGTIAVAIFIEGTFGSDREAAAAADPSLYSHLKISGNTSVTARSYAIVGNGTLHGTDIDILGGKIESTTNVAIYHPQVGELTISGNTVITGCSGIEMRSGSLVIEGDGVSVTATDPFMESPLSDGLRYAGVAISVSRYFAEENTGVSVSIEGGTFTATNSEGYVFYENVDEQHAAPVTPENEDNISVSISGGTFEGKIESENVTGFISGGTFTEPVPAAYLEEGFTLTVGDGTYGVEEADELATVTRGEAVYNFATLAEALAFAEDGDMVALLKPATLSETLVIDKAVTLDLGSNALSVNVAGGVGIRIDADNVTVTGGTGGTISATADTVFAVYVNGAKGVLLEGVTIEAHDVAVRAEYDASVKLQNSVIDVTVIENGGSANAVEIIGSDMEIADTSITSVAEPDTLTGTIAVAIFIEGTFGSDREAAAAADPSLYSHLKISGNTSVTARSYAIVGNGTLHGTDIDILGGKIESTTNVAIYHPQVGELTISGNTVITGCSGIEMRSGSLVIEGDGVSVTATDPFMESPLSDGLRYAGVAISVSRYFAEENTGVSVSIEGGTFTATNEEGYAFYEKVDEEHAPAVTPDNQDNLSVSIAGGTFEGKVESTNVTGFISGGMFKYRPAEDYMDPDFVTELQNGYYVPVESSALRAAQTNAQADVREYVAMLGMKWAEVLELEGEGDENAVALVAAYNAIADTTSEKGVAKARLDAMDAADAFAAAQEDAWEQAKADKIAELESWRDENANGLVIPRYIYTAMNSAADEEELNSYFEQAKAEIGDIYAYRNQITAQSEDLQTLKDTLTALNGALTGENNSFDELLANVEEAIGKAQSAIIGTDADSDSLAGIRNYLENTINAALEGIDDAISGTNGIASELAGISDVLNGFTSKLNTITGALDEETGWIAEAIEKAQGDITSILAALDSLADSTDIEALADSLAQILEDIAAVQGTVDEIEGEVSAVSSVQEAKDEALTDIGEWLNNYLDSIIGGTDEANGGALVALAFTAETTDGDIYAKLTKVFSEDNAQLVLRYYNEALASIDAATTVSEVTTAVSTFKAQVASVEAAAQNTTNLTGLYVLLVIVLVAVVVVLVIVIVKKNRSAEAAEQPAEEAEQPVPAEAVPAAEPEQPEPAAEENELAAEADDDKEQVVIAANVRSFSEAYVELNEELLDLFNKVKEYALAKDGAAEVKQSNGICIKRNGKQIVKLTVRRGYPVALFFLENEMLKDFRRTTNTNAKLKIRATELVLREAADLEAAYTMVDLSVEQIDKDIENAKERRREARRARRKQKQLEEEAQQQEIAAGSAENGENERP